MATVLLVPGAWLPGAAWDQVAADLGAKGHDVHAITLPGMQGREQDATPDTDANAYIADIVSFIEDESLNDVSLVGHSYAGGLIAPVAARTGEVRQLIYVDSGPSAPGVPFVENNPQETQEYLNTLVEQEGDGWRLPMPPDDKLEGILEASLQGIDDAGRAAMRAMSRPMPAKTWTGVVAEPYAPAMPLPSVLITSSFPLAQIQQMLAENHPWFAAMSGPEWSFLEVPTGHWPMLSKPQELAQAIDTAITSLP